MLVLNRQPHESVTISEDITVEIIEVRGDRVRLGITAPEGVSIWRTEIAPLFPAKVDIIDIGSRNVSASLNEAYPCHLHGCQDCASCLQRGDSQ